MKSGILSVRSYLKFILLFWQMLGLAQGAFDCTFPYVLERRQFNRSIYEFQASSWICSVSLLFCDHHSECCLWYCYAITLIFGAAWKVWANHLFALKGTIRHQNVCMAAFHIFLMKFMKAMSAIWIPKLSREISYNIT